MAKITMGKKEYDLPEMNFIAVERAWPFIEKAVSTRDHMVGGAAGIAVIAAALLESTNFHMEDFGITAGDISDPKEDREVQLFNKLQYRLKKQILAREMGLVPVVVLELIKEAGLLPASGEALPAGMDALHPELLSRLTETLTGSSPSSSPLESKEVAGNA